MYRDRYSISLEEVGIIPESPVAFSDNDVNLDVEIGRLKFKLPIISAAMDSVYSVTLNNVINEIGGLSLLNLGGLLSKYSLSNFDKIFHSISNNPTVETLQNIYNVDVNLYILDENLKKLRLGHKVDFGVAATPQDAKSLFSIAFNNGITTFVIQSSFISPFWRSTSKTGLNIIKYANKLQNKECTVMVGNVASLNVARVFIDGGIDAVILGIGPGCQSVCRGSLVLMSDYSVKKIENVQIGEDVISHLGKIRKVINKTKHFSKYKMMNISSNNLNLNVTEEHKVLAVRTKECYRRDKRYVRFCSSNCKSKCSKYYYNNYKKEWLSANELKIGDYLCIPKYKLELINVNKLDIAKYIDGKFEQDINYIWFGQSKNKSVTGMPNYRQIANTCNTTERIVGIVVNSNFEDVRTKSKLRVTQYLKSINFVKPEFFKIFRLVEINEDFARLIGYYVAEGGGEFNNDSGTVTFSFGSHEIEYHNDVLKLMKSIFGIDGSIYYSKRNSARIRFCSTALYYFFKNFCGDNVHNKIIPYYIINNANRKIKLEFLRGLIRGDDNFSCKISKNNTGNDRLKITTVSEKLAFNLYVMFNSIGYLSSMTCTKQLNKKWSDVYNVRLDGSELYKFSLEYKDKLSTINSNFKSLHCEDNDYYYVRVNKIVNTQKCDSEVYDLTVDKDNSFIINGYAIHNCTTRYVLGIGAGHISSISEIREYIETSSSRTKIIADGGISNSGDIIKLLCTGAHAVIIGGMFAKTTDAPFIGYHWGMSAGHNRLPRGTLLRFVIDDSINIKRVLFGPSNRDDGTLNLILAIKNALSNLGCLNLDDAYRKTSVVRFPGIATEGKIKK